jgi:hypothetical protein
MSTAFILAGIFWALNNNLRSDLLALGAFVLACLSKENGVLMPIFLVSLGLLNKSWIPSWKRLSPYALLLIGYFIIRKAAISEFARFLVETGIDSISLAPDTIVKTTIDIKNTEERIGR